jgi:phosphoribosylformylglycinamidine synthase, purS protein
MKLKADVRVGLKQGILDAEGQTIKKSLDLLDFTGISEVKTVKVYEIFLEKDTVKECESEVQRICKRLLANPVINDYSIKVENEQMKEEPTCTK